MPCWIPYKEGQYEINKGEDSWGNYNGDYITWNKEFVSEHSSNYKTLFHFIKALDQAEMQYFNLLNSGWTPQQARVVLPNALKIELVMTGFADDWWGQYLVINKKTGLIDKVIPGRLYSEIDKVNTDEYRIVEKGFFPLRCSKGAHPQAQELAVPLREEFIKRRYITKLE